MMAAPMVPSDETLAKLSKITHVIFDVDGLLLDTESLYTKGTQLMLDKYNKTYTMELKVHVMGRPRRTVAEIMIKELNLPLSVDEFVESLQEQMNKIMPDAELLPGAERLLRHLHAHHVPMAVASGSAEDNHGLKTSNHQQLFSLFKHAVLAGSDPDVKRGKPAPDAFLVARDRFETPPDSQNVLVFEDAPNGVLSASAAGMPVIWIPDRTIVTDADNSPVRDQAVLLLNSLEEFRPEWIGLPPFKE